MGLNDYSGVQIPGKPRRGVYKQGGYVPSNDPPELGASYEWFADDIVGTEGLPVAAWPARTGAVTLTGAVTAQPLYRSAAAGLNGQPALDFDGINDSLTGSLGATLSQPSTLIVVGRSAILDTSTAFFVDGDSASPSLRNSVYTFAGRWHAYAGIPLDSGVTDDTVAHLFIATFNSTASALSLDGVEIASGDAGTGGPSGIRVGSRYDGTTSFLDGEIAYIGLMDTVISAGQKASLLAWSQSKYGTP